MAFKWFSRCLQRNDATALPPNLEAESIAHQQYLINMAQSELCKVPTELILHICRHTEPVDLLSLEASCRHFRIVLHVETKQRLPLPKQRGEFMRRLNKDQYPQTVLAETIACMNPNYYPQMLLCSDCYCYHPMSAFKPEATLISPLKRVCRGVTGVIRVCNHRLMTFAEIRDAISAGVDYPCHHLDHHKDARLVGNSSVFPYLSCITPEKDPCRKGQRWFMFTTVAHFELPDWEFSQNERLRSSLVSVNAYLCPHLRSSSPAFIKNLQLKLKSCNRFSSLRLTDSNGREWIPSVFVECSERDCNVQVSLLDVGLSIVFLQVLSPLGNLLKPSAESWLAKVEDKTKFLPLSPSP